METKRFPVTYLLLNLQRCYSKKKCSECSWGVKQNGDKRIFKRYEKEYGNKRIPIYYIEISTGTFSDNNGICTGCSD